jgi:hypothetical protein
VFLFRDDTRRLVIGVVFVSLLFMTASATAEVFFLKEDLQASDAVYGLLFAAWMVGMVLGALVVARRVPGSALVSASSWPWPCRARASAYPRPGSPSASAVRCGLSAGWGTGPRTCWRER